MKRNIILSLFALFTFFAVGAAIATVYITKTTEELSRLVKLHQVENLRRALVISIQTVQSDLFTVHTPFGGKLDSIVHHVTNLEKSARVCTSCHHSPSLTTRLEEIQDLIQEYQTQLSYYITASANKEKIEKIEREAAALGNKILLHTEEMSLTASSKLAEMTSEAMAKIKDVRIILFITLISSFFFGLLVSVNFTRSITKRMKELLDATRAIASGSLGHKISYSDKTEFGELARNFNMMSGALEKGYASLKATNLELQREITERMRAEEKIEAAYRLTHDILEKSPFGVFVVDSKGMVEYANYSMLEINGETFEELVGSNVYELQPNIEIGLPERIKFIFEGKPFFMEAVEYTSYYGEKTTIRNYIGIPFGEESTKALIFVEDITERIKLEEQLRHIQKMEAIGTLTGGIAHEFNNILTAIIGCSEEFLEEIPENSPLRMYPEMILASAKRAANLTQGLLTYSRKQITHKKPVSLNTIIMKLKGFLSGLITEDIELELLSAAAELTVMGDSNQIEQIIINLVTNAKDAMPGGGTLTVSTGRTRIDKEFIRIHGHGKPGTYALISVRDSGVGMDEKTRERIFEPFFTTKEVGKGTGLGLSMVYGIVKKHNGYVDVDSEPDMGTTVKIYLPLVKSHFNEIDTEEASSPLKGGDETILIAEDDNSVRILLRRCLEKSGYKVIEARDGEDAIKKFEECKDDIQLLILDVIMPRKNGKETYDEIRKKRSDIQALFMSGYSEEVIQEKGFLKEGLNYISKPVSQNELLSTVRNILDPSLAKKLND